jgi:hypothetical protein
MAREVRRGRDSMLDRAERVRQIPAYQYSTKDPAFTPKTLRVGYTRNGRFGL